ENWSHVSDLSGLSRLAEDRRQEGRVLRVATHFPNLVAAFLRARGVQDFLLETQYEGTLEMAPNMGTADLIADLSETGTTIKENHVKTLTDGVVLRSQACLIGNRRTLVDDEKLEVARQMLELMEANLRAQDYYSLIANVAGESAENVAARIVERPD